MSDQLYHMSFFRTTPCCPNHPGTPSCAVGIWTERSRTFWTVCVSHRPCIGRAKVGIHWEIRIFCSSYPEKMAMAARHAERQWTLEVCRPLQWVSDSLNAWIWVQLVLFFGHARGWRKGFQHRDLQRFLEVPTPRKRQWRDLKGALWGADLLEWTIRVYERWSSTLLLKLYNWWSLGGWLAVLHTYVLHVQGHKHWFNHIIFVRINKNAMRNKKFNIRDTRQPLKKNMTMFRLLSPVTENA